MIEDRKTMQQRHMQEQKALLKRHALEDALVGLPVSDWSAFEEVQPTRGKLQAGQRMFKNSKYTVVLERQQSKKEGFPGLVHLSIRTNENDARHDFRDYQRIKNELVGPEIEMVELYPAESRLVDTVNQFHLFGIDDVHFRWPFGFNERLIAEGPYEGGAKQRPFVDKPSDCKSADDLEVLRSEIGEV